MKFDIENKGNALVLTYKLEEKEELDKFCYGMLVNNKIEGIATVTHSQMNTEKYMKFAVDCKTSFAAGFSGIISQERLLKVFDSLTATLLKADEYGISFSSFLLNAEYAYFDSKTSKTVLLCVPISSFENEVGCPAFFLSLLTKIQPDTKECYDAISRIGTFANDPANFSLAQMRDIIDELLGRPSRANLTKKEPVFLEADANPAPVFDERFANQEGFVMGERNISSNVQNPVGVNLKQKPQQAPTAAEIAAQRKPVTDFNIPRAVPNGGFAVPGGNSMPGGKEKPKKQKKEKPQKQAKEKKNKNVDQEAKPSILARIFIKQPKKDKPPVAVPGAPAYGNFPTPGVNPLPQSPVVPQNSLKAPPAKQQPQQPTVPPPPTAYQPAYSNQPVQQGTGQPQNLSGAQPPAAYKPAMPAQPQNQQPPVNPPQKPSYQPVQPNAPQPPPQNPQIFNQPQGQQAQQNQMNPGLPQQIQISVQIPSQQPYNTSVDMPGFKPNVTVTNGNGDPVYSHNSRPPQNEIFGGTTVLNDGGTTVLYNGENPLVAKKYPKLVREKTGEVITLNKPIFRIGKEKSYVDYFISDNSAISRSHADIVTRDGEHFIKDTNSTNHTYIDGKLIDSNVEYKIVDGSKIRMANEDFSFIVEV